MSELQNVMGEHSYLRAQEGPTLQGPPTWTQMPGTGGNTRQHNSKVSYFVRILKAPIPISRHDDTKTERSVKSSCVAHYWAIKTLFFRSYGTIPCEQDFRVRLRCT